VVLSIVALALYWLHTGRSGEPQALPDIKKVEIKKESMDLAIYYVKITGSDAHLVREIHSVPYSDDGPGSAIKELIGGEPKTPGAERVLPADTRLLGISINESLAIVDFSSEVLKAGVGSTGEALGIQSIVNTLTEFPQIREVSFRMEGRSDGRAMDWWGHVGLYGQPFKRNLEKVHQPAIWVTHPVAGQVSGVPLLIKGSARIPGGRVKAHLLDENGKKIAEGTAASPTTPGRGDFEINITYTPPGKGKGTLEVFWNSSGKEPPRDTVKIPIQWP